VDKTPQLGTVRQKGGVALGQKLMGSKSTLAL